MRAVLPFAFFTLLLSACSNPPIIAPVELLQHSPLEQAPTPSNEKILPVQSRVTSYLCHQQKSVRLTQNANEKKSITIEFNQTSHKLSSSVPKTGKRKFSNIRWIWTEEFDDTATLRDKNGKILASHCVKQ